MVKGEIMTTKNIDKQFEKMSRECANKMNGTRPPKTLTKKTPTKKKG